MNISFCWVLLFTTLFSLFSCKTEKPKEEIVYEAEVFDTSISYADLGFLKLSEYDFFKGNMAELNPSGNVFPYDLNTTLFSDYAKKKRFISLPEGTKIDYNDTESLNFPIGTALIKNFYYDGSQLTDGKSRIIETRLLIKKPDKWIALPYIWNDDQTEAILEITGGEQQVALLGKQAIKYQIPNMGQCKGCHERDGKIEPIGQTARQLNRNNTYDGKEVNQLMRLDELGLINNMPNHEVIPKLPIWDQSETGSLDSRARAYLEINCAHCHRIEGPAKNSGLYLIASNENNDELGIMKAPVAAGHGSGNLKYDIVPGNPNQYIMVHRMNSTEASVMMPELGRRMIHSEGVELIREWIQSLGQ